MNAAWSIEQPFGMSADMPVTSGPEYLDQPIIPLSLHSLACSYLETTDYFLLGAVVDRKLEQ